MNRFEVQQRARGAYSHWFYYAKHGLTMSTFQEYLADVLYDAFHKELQDMAYSTYASNIQWSRDLDLIWGRD